MTRKVLRMFFLIKTQVLKHPLSPEGEKRLPLILVQGHLGSISSQDDWQWDCPLHSWINLSLSSGQPRQTHQTIVIQHYLFIKVWIIQYYTPPIQWQNSPSSSLPTLLKFSFSPWSEDQATSPSCSLLSFGYSLVNNCWKKRTPICTIVYRPHEV